MSHTHSTLEERLKRAAAAKTEALNKLRSKPPVDPAVLAERQARQAKREAADAQKRADKAAAAEQAKLAKEAKAAEAAAAAAAAAPPTEAELKAARDARYAARKKRK